jgi:hypothetical protein
VDLLGFDASEIVKEAEAICSRQSELYEAICHPFPDENIDHIRKTVTSRKIVIRRLIKKGFALDLGWYFDGIVGASSWSLRSLSRRAHDERLVLLTYVDKGFFEKYPNYLPLQRWITETNTPALYRDLVLYEEIRLNALRLMNLFDKLESR